MRKRNKPWQRWRLRLFFELRYLQKRTPWDTYQSPPELLEFLDNSSPGRALDIGCGTGTNAITMAEKGWQVIGVDFSRYAVLVARSRTKHLRGLVGIHRGDVSRLGSSIGRFHLVLDIGCMHAVSGDDRRLYADLVKRVLEPGGTFLLYTRLREKDSESEYGLLHEEIESLFCPELNIKKNVVGEEKEKASAWYWITKS